MIAALAAACGDSVMTQAVLKEDPAARIVMPASTLLGEVGGEKIDTPTGPSPAFYGRIAGTEESPSKVHAYFARELLALDWIQDAPPALGVSERDGWGWCKPRIRFRLTIVDPVRLARTGISLGTDLPATVYDATLMASDRVCPRPKATWPPSPSR